MRLDVLAVFDAAEVSSHRISVLGAVPKDASYARQIVDERGARSTDRGCSFLACRAHVLRELSLADEGSLVRFSDVADCYHQLDQMRERAERTPVGKPLACDQVREFEAASRVPLVQDPRLQLHLGFAGLGMGDHAAVAIVPCSCVGARAFASRERHCSPCSEELSIVVVHDLVLAEKVPLKTARAGDASLGLSRLAAADETYASWCWRIACGRRGSGWRSARWLGWDLQRRTREALCGDRLALACNLPHVMVGSVLCISSDVHKVLHEHQHGRVRLIRGFREELVRASVAMHITATFSFRQELLTVLQRSLRERDRETLFSISTHPVVPTLHCCICSFL